eukprot:SAG31_NODE_17980_length_651_cov_0.677536_1_plen_137_part_10
MASSAVAAANDRCQDGIARCREAGIPLIDVESYLAATKAGASCRAAGTAADRAVNQWRSAMEQLGLAVIVGHGLGDDLFDSLHGSAREFFACTPEEKQQSFFVGMSAAMMRGGPRPSDCRWTWKRLNAPASGWKGSG